jgi:hypothetical protein
VYRKSLTAGKDRQADITPFP